MSRLASLFSKTIFWSQVKTTLQQEQSNECYALIFIHGYNISFEAAALRGAQLGCDLKIPSVRMAFYSWPSKAKLERYPSSVTFRNKQVV
ncbi:alpha/beta hydrolase [Nostoc sp.]|uniref:alpha/beta hydrolase n=1 Tax=Nostoc sp. TaxID=1180 RepID=UPI002FF8E528